jgi:hypothetical protein
MVVSQLIQQGKAAGSVTAEMFPVSNFKSSLDQGKFCLCIYFTKTNIGIPIGSLSVLQTQVFPLFAWIIYVYYSIMFLQLIYLIVHVHALVVFNLVILIDPLLSPCIMHRYSTCPFIFSLTEIVIVSLINT